MITVTNLSLPYAIDSISCHIPRNKLVGIMGANGAGKSSLLKSIAGIITPQSGNITIDGTNLAEMNYAQRGDTIAYLDQSPHVHWQMCVYDVIALGLNRALPKHKEKTKINQLAEIFRIQHLLKKTIQTLSGGERARVHLARCCIKDAPIMLADEPIAPLDPYYQIDIMQYLKALSENLTCVVVMHHLSLAYRYCDEIILLKSGKVIDSGATQSVLITENLASAFAISATIDNNTNSIYNIQKIS